MSAIECEFNCQLQHITISAPKAGTVNCNTLPFLPPKLECCNMAYRTRLRYTEEVKFYLRDRYQQSALSRPSPGPLIGRPPRSTDSLTTLAASDPPKGDGPPGAWWLDGPCGLSPPSLIVHPPRSAGRSTSAAIWKLRSDIGRIESQRGFLPRCDPFGASPDHLEWSASLQNAPGGHFVNLGTRMPAAFAKEHVSRPAGSQKRPPVGCLTQSQ
jgi:hypothetical protein